MHVSTAYVGIDVAKRFHVVCVKDASKRSLIPSLQFDDTEDGYATLRDCFDALKAKHHMDMFSVAVESTGSYHEHIVQWLREQPDVLVTVVNPFQTKHFLMSDLRRASTDAVSAELLAQYAAERTPDATRFLPEQYESAKQLARHLHSLTKQKTIVINRLREHVGRLWPDCERHFRNFSGVQVLAFLTAVQTPKALAQRDPTTLKHITVNGTTYTLRANFFATVGDIVQQSRPQRHALTTEPIIKNLAQQALLLVHQMDETTTALRSLLCETKTDTPLLATINGVGDVSAAVITAAIGDPHRFSSVKQICAYFGLNPYVHTSGATIRGANHIQKKGDSTARYYLFNCVLSMIRNERHLIGAFYHRLLARGKPKLVAITACMRKLISIMFTMLKTNTPYNPNFVHVS
jgi:transposase